MHSSDAGPDLTPSADIFTAIIAGFLISTLGGWQVQIGGPASAFIVVLYSIVENYGIANLLISTIFAGIFYLSFPASPPRPKHGPLPMVSNKL